MLDLYINMQQHPLLGNVKDHMFNQSITSQPDLEVHCINM